MKWKDQLRLGEREPEPGARRGAAGRDESPKRREQLSAGFPFSLCTETDTLIQYP
jgi:hypothetical protein